MNGFSVAVTNDSPFIYGWQQLFVLLADLICREDKKYYLESFLCIIRFIIRSKPSIKHTTTNPLSLLYGYRLMQNIHIVGWHSDNVYLCIQYISAPEYYIFKIHLSNRAEILAENLGSSFPGNY